QRGTGDRGALRAQVSDHTNPRLIPPELVHETVTEVPWTVWACRVRRGALRGSKRCSGPPTRAGPAPAGSRRPEFDRWSRPRTGPGSSVGPGRSVARVWEGPQRSDRHVLAPTSSRPRRRRRCSTARQYRTVV